MRNIMIVRQKQQLDNLFDRIRDLSDTDLQSHWARYLCIRTAGFLETSVRAILSEYVSKKASPNIINYVERQLAGFQNPNMEKVLTLIGAFDSSWETTLRDRTEGILKDSIDSIVNNRHNIAHGRNTGIHYS